MNTQLSELYRNELLRLQQEILNLKHENAALRAEVFALKNPKGPRRIVIVNRTPLDPPESVH